MDVDALRQMGNPKADHCLPEVRGLTREAGIALLDRAAGVGLLAAHGRGYYSIHPALPWYFRDLFAKYYRQADGRPKMEDGGSAASDASSSLQPPASSPGMAATRAYVEAIGALGNHYFWQYEGGNRDVIGALEAEEANLLHARRLARANGWWNVVINAMQGLRQLYDHTGRRAAWAKLVGEIVPDFVAPATGGPLPGREEQWSLVADYRVRLAREARRWDEAERLQPTGVDWNRQRAAPALAIPPEQLDAGQRNAIRSLAVSLHALGQIHRELGQAECVPAYEEALELVERIGGRAVAAACAFNLGHVYMDIPTIRNLAQAERWYRRSLELHDERDRLGRSKCMDELGLVAYERFKEARAADRPEDELLRHINDALCSCHEALDLLPPNAVNDLAVVHNQLGNIYNDVGDLDRVLPHYRESIRHEEMQGNLYGAAQTRFNVALALANAGRHHEALLYAEAALRNYATYGDGAAAEVQETQGLIAEIERAMRGG
ncbi:MAG TPA: tetratricopeptide repeat protein [Roseiflexaceae bacterium]